MEPPADAESGAGDPAEPPGRPARLAVLASVLVFAWTLPAAAAESPSGKPPDTTALEQQMLRLVNRDRAEHGKKPLAHDKRLAAVARDHSADMAKNGFFGHESPTTGRVRDRLVTARIKVVVAGENVAKNATVERARVALMKSPGHRKNLLREVYTHCGIGIAQDAQGWLYVTQVFAVPAPDVDLKTARKTLLHALGRRRIRNGKLPFQPNPTLDALAAAAAARMAEAGRSLPIPVGPAAKAAGLKHRRIVMVHRVTWKPDEVAESKIILGPAVGRVGVGFAENTKHDKLGLGIIWTVVLFTDD
jgi:uncharacterized protein YkwD